jgi:hypothetical protein
MPQIRVIDATDVERVIARIRISDPSGVERTIQRVRGIDPTGVERILWSGFSGLVTPTEGVSGTDDVAGLADITTGTATVNLAGGTAPFTYAWEEIDNDPYFDWTINSPTAAASTFTCADVPPGSLVRTTFRCTITDDDGIECTALVEAEVRNTNTS